jgi:hypothetical protein
MTALDIKMVMRLGALLDVATPVPSASDDET